MHKLHGLWIGLVVIVSACFYFSLNPTERILEPWALRKSLLYFSGVLALAMMSIGMILILRLRWVEDITGGLDRNYRLHKWLGISGALAALLHWFIKLEPKALVRQGWVEASTFQTPAFAVDFFNHSNPFESYKSIAKSTGEWAIYLLALLVLVSLVKKIPYRRFFLTHRLMPLVYLALVFHAVVLFGKLGWATPIGYLMGVLMSLGSIAALVALSGHIGQQRRHQGVVVKCDYLNSDATTQIDIKMETRWPRHQPGQFAFVTFDPAEGAHPFSIASSPQSQRIVRFFVKHLGDYTNHLENQVRVGQSVVVEGPYGKFSFEPRQAPQIWIAAGVGITPFLSRLEYLSQTLVQTKAPHTPTDIHFYLCVRHDQGDLTQYALSLAAQANIQTHVVQSSLGDQLHAEDLIQAHPDFKQRHFWFCGPSGMGEGLRDSLCKAGLKRQQFHQELFEMR